MNAMPKIAAIYCLTCAVNGKLYVGQARDLRARWRWHRNAAVGSKNLQSYKKRTAIARAMRKHGVDNFVLTILEQCEPAVLDEREMYWIATLGTMVPVGYNLTAGGKSAPRAPVVGEQISASNKGRVKTPEWRAALSASHTGKTLSVEHRQKIGDVQRGKPKSDEFKRKLSVALKGRKLGPYSPERCAAISAGMTEEGKLRTRAASTTPEAIAKRVSKTRGQKRSSPRFSQGQRAHWSSLSDEQKEKRRAQLRGVRKFRKYRFPSEETKQKIAATLRRRNAELRAANG